jgi:hypothetical protein
MIFPHPPVLISQIRVYDIWLLLAIGGLWELICRILLFWIKRKPFGLLVREQELYRLQQKTAEKRKLGPPAFVETSKLERQVLVIEKELGGIQERRKKYAYRLLACCLFAAKMLLLIDSHTTHHNSYLLPNILLDEPKYGRNIF